MPADRTFTALGDQRFLSLTTFRKSGEPVSAPVWVGRDGETLVVTTPANSGKVKRLRNDPRVELRPCGRFGKVKSGAEPVSGVAEIVTAPASQKRPRDLIRKKYGLEYRIVMGIERLRRSGNEERLILRIRPS